MLRARWLGRVPYGEADRLQRALHERAADDYLLLLEHPHVYTLGTTADPAHVLVPPATVGAELVHVDRGGDVTYHGPGQLVGYPIVTLPEWRDGLRDVVAYVRLLEDVLIGALAGFGIEAHREPRYTGVWVGDEKIAAIGVKVARGRTRHGFALNVDPDLAMFDHIVPCGIRDRGVTSMAALLGDGARDARGRRRRRRAVRGALRAPSRSSARTSCGASTPTTSARSPAPRWPAATADPPADGAEAHRCGSSVGWPRRACRNRSTAPATRRPEWMRVKADLGANFRETKRLVQQLDLHTVCEEAGCPNIYECWADHTATFMILGDRCTRACGFCLVDTRKPLPARPRRAPPGRRRGAHPRSRARGDHQRRPRRPRRRRRRRLRRHHRRDPRGQPRHAGRGADPRLQGVDRRARRDLRRPARRAEPQPRDGGPAPPGGPAVGRLRPLARAAGPVLGCGSAHQIGHHPGHG